MGTVVKGSPPSHCHGKAPRASGVTQHAADAVNKQVMGKILAKKINVCIKRIKYLRTEIAS
jgi:hypothetical protein